jgi:uncharacterized protein YndB with AHSA1/START domain
MAFTLRVFLPAPPPIVFGAFQGHVDRWWGYRLRERARVVVEPRVGGRFAQEWDNGGALFGHFTVWDPPQLIVLTGPLAMTRPVLNTVELHFADVPDGTQLEITHRAVGDLEADAREMYASGWQELFGSDLHRFVSSR